MNEKQLIIKNVKQLFYHDFIIEYAYYPQFDWNTMQVSVKGRYANDPVVYHEVLK